MTRRNLFQWLTTLLAAPAASSQAAATSATPPAAAPKTPTGDAWKLTDADWRQRLSWSQYKVLRQEGTERPGSSPLNAEKRAGRYHCAGCDLALFEANMKYDSRTGWPSFFASLPSALETRVDNSLIFSRTEYHCARCGGHQGHVFNDGPAPTGKRYCNNGIALTFKEAA